ncbi:MAG TPA: trehalose-6-phosphate synthase [bacterium]
MAEIGTGQLPPSVWTSRTLREAVQRQLGDHLFIIVSNREPYIHRLEGDEIVCQVPTGGLTVALDPVLRACGGLWVAHGVGEADRRVVDEQDHVQVPPEDPSYLLRRIWLSTEEEDGYYYGFANQALWPLCHISYTRPVFDLDDWNTYRAVNRRFADAVLEEIGHRNAFVFIQDYHFALLANMLRRPNIRIAHFWHIPWPNPEVFRICPWGDEILTGLLGSDLLGFHIRYHCQNFMETVNRLLEARVDYERYEVSRGGRTTRIRPFPISVDFDAISSIAAGEDVTAQVDRLRRAHGLRGMYVALGVDRVDYTKGIPERLRALDLFLERYPEFLERFVYVQVAAKSRQRLPAYRAVAEEIDRTVESINRKYRRSGWRPILVLDGDVPQPELQAWYRLADMCIVSSLHDGMNLAAKEFVASRVDDDGVLVLSQFTGAAREFTDVELINPFDPSATSEAIHRAATLPPEEVQRRMRRLRMHLHEQNIFRWAGKILSALFQFEFHDG